MERISLKRMGVIFGLALVISLSYVISIMIYHTIVQSSGIHFKTNTADSGIHFKTNTTDSIRVKNDKFLFVAVLTAQKFLETRARAIYNTWGHRVPGKILFFVGANVSYTGNLPVHELSDVKDETYPPQKKSFAMLSYVATHYIGEYEWFMRADDDVFVKTDSFESFLRSFNNSELLYMGQAKEKGKLGLVHNAPYCVGGPGVVFSPITLRILAQFLPRCLNSTYTLHEDTEIGRCVQRNLGIACTNANNALFHHNYNWDSGKFDLKLGSTEDRALTLHPLKKPLYMYHVENYFNTERLKHLRRN